MKVTFFVKGAYLNETSSRKTMRSDGSQGEYLVLKFSSRGKSLSVLCFEENIAYLLKLGEEYRVRGNVHIAKGGTYLVATEFVDMNGEVFCNFTSPEEIP